MSQRKELKNNLLTDLAQKLKPLGYTLNLSLAEYTRRNKGGWDKFQLIFLIASDGWRVKIGALIRIDQIEDLYHTISHFEPKYHRRTPTLGVMLSDYGDLDKEEYFLSRSDQIKALVEELLVVFDETALPFFDSFRSLSSIDKAINENSDNHLTGSIFKGFKGTIAARLVDRSNYWGLVHAYRHYYESAFNGFYLSEYNNLIEQLEDNNATENHHLS